MTRTRSDLLNRTDSTFESLGFIEVHAGGAVATLCSH